MQRLIDGHKHFLAEVFPARRQQFHLLSESQAPEFLFITCADSRVVPDLILGTGPGDLFITRNAGNVVPVEAPEGDGVTATIEYAVEVLKVRHAILCGHSDCGAMKAVATCACLDHMPAVKHWLHYADAARMINESKNHADENARIDGMVRENVIAQLNNIRTHPSVALALAQDRLTLHGWVYDIESGSIDALDAATNSFIPLAAHPASKL